MRRLRTLLNKINSIEFNVQASLIVVSIVPLIIYFIMNNVYVTNNFLKMEMRNIAFGEKQIMEVIDSEGKKMERMAKDYAIWDEAYERIGAKHVGWFKENFSEWLPKGQGVDLIIVIDKNKEIMDKYGLENDSYFKILNDKAIREVLEGKYDGEFEEYPYGLKQFQGELYFIAVCPIMLIDYSEPSNGLVILGRKITNQMLHDIGMKYGYGLCISYGNKILATPEWIDNCNDFLGRNTKGGNEEGIWLRNSKIIKSTIINDISNNNYCYLYTIGSRDMFLTTLDLIRQNGYWVLVLTSIIIIGMIIKSKNIIVKPIKSFEEQIVKMLQDSSLGHIKMEGPREIMSLTTTFNLMADTLRFHKDENSSLKARSITDGLTSLYNHSFIFDYFQSKITDGIKEMAVIFCDIDHFKKINDTHGHVIGDEVLKEVASLIKNVMSENGAAFRYGGEEFVSIIHSHEAKHAYEMAEDIRLKIVGSKEIQKYCVDSPITISIGLAFYPSDGTEIDTIINKADQAMYDAKENGRNQTHVYTN